MKTKLLVLSFLLITAVIWGQKPRIGINGDFQGDNAFTVEGFSFLSSTNLEQTSFLITNKTADLIEISFEIAITYTCNRVKKEKIQSITLKGYESYETGNFLNSTSDKNCIVTQTDGSKTSIVGITYLGRIIKNFSQDQRQRKNKFDDLSANVSKYYNAKDYENALDALNDLAKVASSNEEIRIKEEWGDKISRAMLDAEQKEQQKQVAEEKLKKEPEKPKDPNVHTYKSGECKLAGTVAQYFSCPLCGQQNKKEIEAKANEDKRVSDAKFAKEEGIRKAIEAEEKRKQEEARKKKLAAERADFKLQTEYNNRVVSAGVVNLSGLVISPSEDIPYVKSGKVIAEGYEQSFIVDNSGAFRSSVVLKSGVNKIQIQIGNKVIEQYITLDREPVDLRVTLTWNATADIDLYIIDPDGYTCNYKNKTIGNMNLDVDNTTAYGPENIYVKRVKKGNYKVIVQNYAKGIGVEATLYIFINEILKEVKKVTFLQDKEFIDISQYNFDN